MRIALDVTCAAKSERTGIGRYAENLVRALGRCDNHHDFDLLYRLTRWKRLRHRLPLPSDRFHSRLFGELLGGFLLRNTDVVHGLDARIPRTRVAKRIATLHDVFSALRDDLAGSSFRAKKMQAYRELATDADLIVAVSPGTSQDFLRLYPEAQGKVEVVPHGVDPAFHPRAEAEIAALRARLHLPEHYVFFVGLLSTRKNCVRMIEAFTQIAPAHADLGFVLAGGASHGFAEIAAAHERSPVRERIHRIGFVDPRDLPALYSGAEALVFSTLYEGFGLPIIEAHACGCPVIASDQLTPREVGGAAAHYVNPEDVASIAQGIELALVDGRRSDRVQLRRASAARFDWDKTARHMLEIYDRVAAAS